jgi:hypothetical protein
MIEVLVSFQCEENNKTLYFLCHTKREVNDRTASKSPLSLALSDTFNNVGVFSSDNHKTSR